MFFVALGLGALLMLMARTNSTSLGTSPPPTSSSSRKKAREGPSGQERTTKARHDAHRQCVEEKGVTCERWVDKASLGPRDEVVKIIEQRGLKLWFEEVKRYNLGMCHLFF